MTTIDDLSDELATYGVHEGYATQRRALASGLHSDGIRPPDVELLADWIRRKNPRSSVDARATKLAAILADPKERGERLADIRFVQERQQARDVFKPEADTDLDEADRALRVAARVDADRRRLDDVATEFGLEAGMAAHLLKVGRALRAERGAPPPPDIEDEEAIRARIDRWERARAIAAQRRISMDQALQETP